MPESKARDMQNPSAISFLFRFTNLYSKRKKNLALYGIKPDFLSMDRYLYFYLVYVATYTASTS